MNGDIFSNNHDDKKWLQRRHRVGNIWHAIFLSSTGVGILALSILFFSIINQAFGYVAWSYKIQPSTLDVRPLEDLNKDELITILRTKMSAFRLRTIEREKLLNQRDEKELYALVMEKVIEPKVIQTWGLTESIFLKKEIDSQIKEKHPEATITFHAWLNPQFLERTMSSQAQMSGVRTALLGSIFIIIITIITAFPIGVGAAIYLEEYADSSNHINRIIQTNIDNLAGVPSIIYGILGLTIFVRSLSLLTSGALFGIHGDNGRTILSAGLTLALLILPLMIINAQEAIRAVPNSLRQASYGIGATRWQTIIAHVLPYALPGIMTGMILSISRALGETAPLILVGASTFITSDANSLFSSFTTLPIQIYGWTVRPQQEFRNVAAAAIIVLLAALLTMNTGAILIRNRFMSKRR